MFGYVRPFKDELKVKDYELYRSVYCGLCHSLKKRCGAAGRFIINYDFTFLAMLLSFGETGCHTCRKKCMVSPLNGRKIITGTEPYREGDILDKCADMSIILTWWKLKDGIRDDGFFKALALRIASLFLIRGYKKSVANLPDYAENCKLQISELNALENSGCKSVDEASEKFALILSKASEAAESENSKRILGQLLFQLGKLIYILDAYCDIDEDRKKGSYNPIIAKYGSKPDRAGLEMIMRHTLGFITSAYELLDGGVFSPVLENTVYLGLPAVISLVLEGKFTQQSRKNREVC